MGTYFKIIDKTKEKPRTFKVRAPWGSQILFCEVEQMVDMLPNPANDIPHALEADGWGVLAAIGERYEADEFNIECISEEEYREEES